MAAPPLSNTFEGGSSGTAISTGNSGGGSGNAFDTVAPGASGSITFDNTHSLSGMAMKVANTVSEVCNVVWTGLGSLTSNVYFRAYCYMTALPNAHWYFGRSQTGANAKCLAPEIDTAGKFTFENAAGTDNASVSTNAAPTNQFFRVEWRVLPSTTVGEVEFRLYLTDPEAPVGNYTELKLYTAQALGANINTAAYGITDTAAPTNWSGGVWMDNVAVSTAGWNGPANPSNYFAPHRQLLGV